MGRRDSKSRSLAEAGTRTRAASMKALSAPDAPSPNGAAMRVAAPLASGFALPVATPAEPVPDGAALDHPSLFFNRELGWLDFNWRVLAQAMDERLPLLERVRFVAITASNLDEFYQKRIGGLRRQEAANVRLLSPDGRTPQEQLALVREAAREQHAALTAIWERTLRPALQREAGVLISDFGDLSAEQSDELQRHFRTNIYPILTPLAVDPSHPFPFISNLSQSLAVILRNPTRGTTHFARIKVPTQRRRWVAVGGNRLHLVPLEQVIEHCAGQMFPGMEVVSVHTFRVTRSADVRRNQEEAGDLIAMISEEISERRFAAAVRVEVESAMPQAVRQFLIRQLEIQPEELVDVEGLLDLTACADIADLPLPACRWQPWEPVVPARLRHEGETEAERDIFAVIRQGDVLVHHPYESFAASVQRLVEEAAADEKVIAIKQTLYRTSEESPNVEALIRAAEGGKQVAVLVEVQARFDEARNIEWGQTLEDAGVHVAYGLVGLKTHAKVTLVVREERDGPRTYCHIGTGNYHNKTARLYTDLGLFTAAPEVGNDLINLFHYLTGYAPDQQYGRLIVAPRDMRRRFVELIQQEVAHHQKHGTGRIIAKMNALEDVPLIQELYRASQAGVPIDLIIRGQSRLRPGLPGYSETIRLTSLIGRFLEHDRIYHFANNGQPITLIGSADWRGRNLDDRVEALVPVETPALQRRLVEMLELALADNRLAWDLQPDGRYLQRRPADGEPPRTFHDALMQRAAQRGEDG